MGLPIDTCLQCGESRESVRRNEYICATLTGYETVETKDEWPRHHWRDWSDADLAAAGLSRSRWAENRRTHIYDLQWAAIESMCERDGHVLSSGEEYEIPGHCQRCFAPLESSERAR